MTNTKPSHHGKHCSQCLLFLILLGHTEFTPTPSYSHTKDVKHSLFFVERLNKVKNVLRGHWPSPALQVSGVSCLCPPPPPLPLPLVNKKERFEWHSYIIIIIKIYIKQNKKPKQDRNLAGLPAPFTPFSLAPNPTQTLLSSHALHRVSLSQAPSTMTTFSG